MNNTQFKKYYAQYYVEDRTIQRLARKLAKNDQSLFDDLCQIGLITLWKLDPQKSTTNEGAWIRQALKFRMIDYVRKERAHNSVLESLDACLDSGDQLEKDPESGRFQLYKNSAYTNALPKDMLRDYTKLPATRPEESGFVEVILEGVEQLNDSEHPTS